MSNRKLSAEEKKAIVRKSKPDERAKEGDPGGESASPLVSLQQQVGNRAVGRLLAQRSGEGSMELDDETAERVSRARGGGQPLDGTVQQQAGAAMGQDFGNVRVHDSPESDELNQQLGARAFTTGQDIFFREGAYQPHTSSGQELIAHELTHVAQQGSGALGSDAGGRMSVNPPGDAFEQQADAVAKAVVGPGAQPGVQRQEFPEEEEVQAQRLQRQEFPEDEEIQAQVEEEEEEEPIQTQEMEEDEAFQMQEEEEYEEV